MRDKLTRYGTRTRLTEKQLTALRRLTHIRGDADLRLVVDNQPRQSAHYDRPRQYIRRRLRYRDIKLAVAATLMVILVLGSAFKAGVKAIGFTPNAPHPLPSRMKPPSHSSAAETVPRRRRDPGAGRPAAIRGAPVQFSDSHHAQFAGR